MSELSGEEEVKAIAANGGLIPYIGWVAITVNLPGNLDPSLSISVPVLIISYPIDSLLIGFNVLDVLISNQPERLMSLRVSLLSNTVSVPNEKAEAPVNFIRSTKSVVQQGRLRIGVEDIVLPAGKMSRVKSRTILNLWPNWGCLNLMKAAHCLHSGMQGHECLRFRIQHGHLSPFQLLATPP